MRPVWALSYRCFTDPIFPPSDDYISGPIGSAAETGGWAMFLIGLALIFISPLVEEVLYRGVLYTGLAISLGKVVSGVIVTCLFVGMHVGEFGTYWVPLSAIWCLSVVTLLLRELKGSVMPAILLHVGYNFIQVLGIYSRLGKAN